MSNPISHAFQKAKKENRPALLTYTVAGDSSKKQSLKMNLNPFQRPTFEAIALFRPSDYPPITPGTHGPQISKSNI